MLCILGLLDSSPVLAKASFLGVISTCNLQFGELGIDPRALNG
jgi:hypothetical protein